MKKNGQIKYFYFILSGLFHDDLTIFTVLPWAVQIVPQTEKNHVPKGGLKTNYIQNYLNQYYFHQIMASLWMLARLFQFDLDFPIIADPIIGRENWLLTPEQEQDFFFVFSQQ